LHVEENQGRALSLQQLERRRAVFRLTDIVPLAAKSQRDQGTNGRIVVDHENEGPVCHAQASPAGMDGGTVGIVTTKRLPTAEGNSTRISPPCCSTIWRLMYRPRPRPDT